MPLTHRTRSQPGPEQSLTEIKLRNLLQTRFQMITATPEQYAAIDAKIAELRAKMDAPKRERKATKPLEKSIQKDVMKLLRKHPKVARVWRQNSMQAKFTDRYGGVRRVNANTAKGMADIMGVLTNGRMLAIEMKRPGDNPERHQQAFLNSINIAGGLAFVARSVADVIEALNSA
jgi:hypothetical protein